MADTNLDAGPDLSKPDRRGILKSMAALPLFVSPAFALRGGSDAELTALWDEYEAARAAEPRSGTPFAEPSSRATL